MRRLASAMSAVAIAWILLAALHALPAFALVSPALLARLYGAAPGSTASVLLQHRAALFVAVLVACLWAAWRPDARPLATVVVAISMLSFLALYVLSGMPASLRMIAIADTIGLPVLAFAAWRAFAPRD